MLNRKANVRGKKNSEIERTVDNKLNYILQN